MGSCRTLGDNTLRVPTFYSHDKDDLDDEPIILALVVCVATVFGAIHCIAWSFHFATFQERWVWRISTILVLGVPMFVSAALIPQFPNNTWMNLLERFLGLIGGVMMFLYIISRIVLLVLPFVALRALPPGAYVQLNWVSFLPHI